MHNLHFKNKNLNTYSRYSLVLYEHIVNTIVHMITFNNQSNVNDLDLLKNNFFSDNLFWLNVISITGVSVNRAFTVFICRFPIGKYGLIEVCHVSVPEKSMRSN